MERNTTSICFLDEKKQNKHKVCVDVTVNSVMCVIGELRDTLIEEFLRVVGDQCRD